MRLYLEDVLGEFEILRIGFGKEDMEDGRKKEKQETIIGEGIHIGYHQKVSKEIRGFFFCFW